MIESTIDIVSRDGELERYQIVRGFGWKDLDFVYPEFSQDAFDSLCAIYEIYIMSRHRDEYRNLVLFHVSDGTDLPLSSDTIFDKDILLSSYLNDGCCSEPFESLIERLGSLGRVRVFHGTGDKTIFIPVADTLGFLSSESGRVLTNSHFFEMEILDIDSPYDKLGTPFGLALKDGVVLSPPLFGREALLVDYSGNVSVRNVDIRNLEIRVLDKSFKDGINCTIYDRPEMRVTPLSDSSDLVIVGKKVIAIKEGGNTRIPMAGFVLSIDRAIASQIKDSLLSAEVAYSGMERYLFGIQVGSSLVVDGKASKVFCSSFYDNSKDGVPFPPCVYPLDYDNARSARMALGSDCDSNPVLIWAEGANKMGYRKGLDSSGVSLSEFADYSLSLGLRNVINLDGGGSAEIFISGKRSMHVTANDRERPIPIGLIAK